MDEKQPIVVKRIVKGGGHHGGAWKIAYADFVTAMMAFFLLMWLMASTTKEQKAAISEYFNNPSMEQGLDARPKANGSDGQGGVNVSVIDLVGAIDEPVQPIPGGPQKTAAIDPDAVEDAAAAAEKERMEELKKEIEKAMDKVEELQQFKDQLIIDMTEEGLRIQIVDKDNRPMFDLGSSRLLPHAETILREVTHAVAQVSNRLSITGHTDARPLNRSGYSNWELSAERANAARRALVSSGLTNDKIARVVGLSSSDLFEPKDPMAPINRRISIIVLSRKVDHPNPAPAQAQPAGKK